MNLDLSKLPYSFKIIEENILIDVYKRKFINEEPIEQKVVEITNQR